MQKKVLNAIVAVLAVAVLVGAGFYFKDKGKGHTLAASLGTALDLSGESGTLPEDWYVSSYENEYEAFLDGTGDRKSTRLNSSHPTTSRMPSSA